MSIVACPYGFQTLRGSFLIKTILLQTDTRCPLFLARVILTFPSLAPLSSESVSILFELPFFTHIIYAFQMVQLPVCFRFSSLIFNFVPYSSRGLKQKDSKL